MKTKLLKRLRKEAKINPTMKLCEEDNTLRNKSMLQLNEHLSELYKSLSYHSKYKNRKACSHIKVEIQKVKHEQTLRRKGLRTQGVWINNTTLPVLKPQRCNHKFQEAEITAL